MLVLMGGDLLRILLWLFWDFSGCRWVWEHLFPPMEKEKKKREEQGRRPASTFFIMVLSLYLTLYGIASTRYENAAGRIRAKVNIIINQMSIDKTRLNAIKQVALTQRMMLPKKPKLLIPTATIASLMGQTEECEEGIFDLREAVVVWKKSLNGANLGTANLSGADLRDAFFRDVVFYEADLREADLRGADLRGANLRGANLEGIQNWRDVRSWEGANIFGVENDPDGFKEFVLERGGKEEGPPRRRRRRKRGRR